MLTNSRYYQNVGAITNNYRMHQREAMGLIVL